MEKVEDLLLKTTKHRGWNVYDAKVCAWMLKNKTGKATQMEQDLKLRQPTVSISTRKLIKQGIITITFEPKTGGKGRPLIRYHLNKKGISKFFEQMNREIEETVSHIRKLKQILT